MTMKLRMKDGTDLALPSNDSAAARYVADLFLNSGKVPDEDVRLDWDDMYRNLSKKHQTDAVTSPDIRPLLQSSLEILIREPVEPLMSITGLYNRVMSKGLNTQVLAGALGAVTARDIPEHGTYPEVMFQVGGAMQTAYVGKSGIAASFTDEALRYSTWDIMAMNLKLMGNALVRHKEQKAVSFLRTLGTSLFDNVTPATSLFGVCTGRDLAMDANGSWAAEDLFKGMAFMHEEGFPPNVLLMNPQFFYMFLQDPVLRNMMMAHGGGQYFQNWNGVAGPQDPWSNGGMGSQGPSLGNVVVPGGNAAGTTPTGIAGREHGMTASPPGMPYFPWPMEIIVSPFVPFDSSRLTGDIYLMSRGNIGYHLVDQDPLTVEWRDENVDVLKIKAMERYGFAVAHEGQGIGVFKNVKLAQNRWDGTVTAHTLSADAEISPTAVISL